MSAAGHDHGSYSATAGTPVYRSGAPARKSTSEKGEGFERDFKKAVGSRDLDMNARERQMRMVVEGVE